MTIKIMKVNNMVEHQSMNQTLNVTELAKILNYDRKKIALTLKKNTIAGVIFSGNRWIISNTAVPEIKKMIGFYNEFDPVKFVSFSEIAKQLIDSGIEIDTRKLISYQVKKKRIPTINHLGTYYTDKYEAESLISDIVQERVIPEGYSTLTNISKETGVTKETLYRWTTQNKVNSLTRVINGSLHLLISRTDVESLIGPNNPRKLKEMNACNIKEAAKLIGSPKHYVKSLLETGFFPNSQKSISGHYVIPLSDINQFIKMEYISPNDLSLELNVGRKIITNLISRNNIEGVTKKGKLYLIPKEAIKEIKTLLNYNDSYCSSDYIQIFKLADEFVKLKLKMPTIAAIVKFIDREKIPTIKHLSGRYMHKDDLARFISSCVEKRTLIEGFIPMRDAAKKSGLHYETVMSWASSGKIQSVERIINGTKSKIVNWNDIENILSGGSPRDLENPNLVNIEHAASLLECSKDNVRKLIEDGILLNTRKGIYGYLIPREEIDNYLKVMNTPLPPFSKKEVISNFVSYINNITIPEALYETKDLFIEFSINKLNRANGRSKHLLALVNSLENLYRKVVVNLLNPISEMKSQEITDILQRETIPQYIKKFFVQFIKFVCTKNNIVMDSEYVYYESYRRGWDKNDERSRYSPSTYNLYESYVKDIEYHLPGAIKSRHYANMWIYTIMLLTNCWRPSDVICELPNIDLDGTEISSFEWFNENRLTEQISRCIIDQLQLKLRYSQTGKTQSDLIFLVLPDMELPLAYSLILSELHRRKIPQRVLLEKRTLMGSFWTGNKPETILYFTKPRYAHLHFFDKYPVLGDFSPQRLTNSTMTYLFFHVVENGDEDAALAIDFPKRGRSHQSENSTAVYIKTTNKDGTIDRVSLNLFKRGHFGWLYNFMVQYATGQVNMHQSLEERTYTIKNLSFEYSPIELEDWAKVLSEIKERKHNVIQQLMKLDKVAIQQLVLKIYSGLMPSKDNCGQCLEYPNCSNPQRKKCIGCNQFIPHYQILIEAVNEFRRLVSAIQIRESDALLIRDSNFLLHILLIIEEACIAFGEEKVNTFISEQDRIGLLFQISDRIKIE